MRDSCYSAEKKKIGQNVARFWKVGQTNWPVASRHDGNLTAPCELFAAEQCVSSVCRYHRIFRARDHQNPHYDLEYARKRPDG